MFRSLIVRIAASVTIAAAAVAYFGMPYVDRLLAAWYRADVENHSRAVMDRLDALLPPLAERGDTAGMARVLDRVRADQRVLGIVVCRPDGTQLLATEGTPAAVACEPDAQAGRGVSRIAQAPSGAISVGRYDLHVAHGDSLRVLIADDLSFAERQRTAARDYVIAFAGVSTMLIAGLVLLAAWWLLRRWVTVLVGDIRGGRFLDDAHSPRFSLPLLSHVRRVLREVEATQRLEIDFRENWTPQALQQVVKEHLQASQIIAVSNRQPYSHVLSASGQVAVQIPASGMVTALEPIMRACAGVWIAHGSGSADRQVVDRYDRISVPPGDPSYTLRRVWLTPEEEEGYYYGFSNEGLWPLCHLAYVRPAFREADWLTYNAVNRRFAEAVVSEATTKSPVVLVQDFHFALLPQLIRERLPQATIALFWHVPWPNAETFGVCPWKREILEHMLRADILGFHTRYHCQNFLATADRFVECQIDHEHMTVTLQGHVCNIVPYPISIEWPPRWLAHASDVATARANVMARYGLTGPLKVGVGVERWDFTKGIIERFHALEVFFERYPKSRGQVTFLQIAAPSRSKLPAYQALQRETMAEVERVNARFATDRWQPIVLVAEHQEGDRVFELYRAADFCLVNSLHDGMNLVAKEFVAAREDEDGVLILSTFAGASRELVEALPVNPFDVTETAEAIAVAINMPRDERRERMRLMRRTVQEKNVHRWAGRMLMDAARIRQRQLLQIRNSRAAARTRYTGTA
jgi:trehalose 6-phosphate synthase/phosphatase